MLVTDCSSGSLGGNLRELVVLGVDAGLASPAGDGGISAGVVLSCWNLETSP